MITMSYMGVWLQGSLRCRKISVRPPTRSATRPFNLPAAIRFPRADPLPDPRLPRNRAVHSRCHRAVVLDPVTSLRIHTTDGVELEAIVDEAASPSGSVVVCHPHPRHGGTMRAPILEAIAVEAARSGLDVLRFNFRGVGASAGSFGEGDDELRDVQAAVETMARLSPELVGIIGWSFGAVIALRWQSETGSRLSYVGIAPPIDGVLSPEMPEPIGLADARRTFIIGDRDQFVDANELEAYGRSIGAVTIRYETADHFFVLRHERLALDVVGALSAPPPGG